VLAQGEPGLDITSGEVKYGDGVTAWASLPMRYTNLRVGGKWRRVANQSIPTSGITLVSWDTEDQDTDNFIVPNATTATTFTIPTGRDGTYAISGQIGFSASPVNGFARLTTSQIGAADFVASAIGWQAGFTQVVPLTAGSTIYVYAFQASGAALNITGQIAITRIGP
jgi:hypothetical protein